MKKIEVSQPSAEAVAIAGDRILAVGATEEMLAHRGPGTQVIDVGGQMVIPGFIEGHGHYTSFGESLLTLDFRYAESFADIVAQVAAAAADTPAGEWIIGRGWHQDKWLSKEDVLVEGLPLHDSLSAATPDHPVMLIHTSGHGVLLSLMGLMDRGSNHACDASRLGRLPPFCLRPVGRRSRLVVGSDHRILR